ncbi:anti-sigma factor [Telluribacter humicola]|uniref:anti-sigma factor n=1 Tax=Telluribacter humicola TaxID=1720261 RepID=UPI001A9765A8|nr:hypothetical protein [Telluribacter humicola]
MELSEEMFNQIHAYLGGEGTVEERSAFEQQMNQSPALAREVATQKRIKSGLKINEYKTQFEGIHAQLKAEGSLPIVNTTLEKEVVGEEERNEKVLPTTSYRSLWRYVAAAASIIVVIGVGWWVYNSTDESPREMVAQDKKPQTNQNTTSEPGTTSPESDPLDTPATSTPSAQAPDLPDTQQLFADAFDSTPDISSPFANDNLGVSPGSVARWQSDTATLHAGIRLLQKGQGASALIQLEKAEKSTNKDIRDHAQWYIALTMLQGGQTGLVSQRLEQIALDTNHPYQERASILLRKLAAKP